MVFKYKLPEPTARKRVSAQEIAREHGLDVVTVMNALADAGEFVNSPRSKSLESPVVRRVCEILGVNQPKAAVERPVPQWEVRGGEGRPPRPRKKAHLRAAPVGAAQFDSADRSAGLGFEWQDASPSFASEEWKLYGFSEVERDLWISEGLRRGQAKLARDLRAAGFLPLDLNVNVLGWTVAKRLRSGESCREVMRLLRQVKEGRQPDRDFQ